MVDRKTPSLRERVDRAGRVLLSGRMASFGAELWNSIADPFGARRYTKTVTLPFAARVEDKAVPETVPLVESRRLVKRAAVPYLLLLLGLYFPPVFSIELYNSFIFLPYLLWNLAYLFPAVAGVLLAWKGESRGIVTFLRFVLGILIVFLLVCLPFSLVVEVFAGPAMGLTLPQVLTPVLFLVALRFLIGPRGVSARRLRPKLTWVTFWLTPGFAIWSVLVFASAFGGALWLSDGRDYCIAQPGLAGSKSADYGPIRSRYALRGTALATAETGYKSYHRWYFHALLLVRGDFAPEIWQWSYKQMRWSPVIGGAFFRAVDDACEPRANFLFDL